MYDSKFSLQTLNRPRVSTFKRREFIPLREDVLWKIRTGAVRIFTIAEDGTPITLGFWGVGDLTGQPLIGIQPCQIECLMDVEAVSINSGQCWDLHRVMLSHIHQMQELLRIRHGQVQQRMQLLLHWLAKKFGKPTEQGELIQLRLTHQAIADAIGTTRVTVSRLMQELEREQIISYSKRHQIVLNLAVLSSSGDQLLPLSESPSPLSIDSSQ